MMVMVLCRLRGSILLLSSLFLLGYLFLCIGVSLLLLPL